MLLLSRFSKLCLSMNSLPASTRPSLSSFSGCAHHWLFPRSRPSLIFLHVADYFSGSQEYVDDSLLRLRISWLFSQVCWFSPGYARRWFVFPGRTIPSLTSLSDCACFFTGRASHSQVAPALVAVIFFQVLLIDDFFAGSHEFFADFLFRLRTSLTFPRSRPSLIFPQVTHVADFFSGSHEYVSFLGCANRWFFHWSRPLLIFPQVSISFSWSHNSLADFFFRLCPSLTIFSQVAQSQFFFMLLLSLLSFSKLCLSMNSLPASTRPSLSSFSGCARHWLFSQVAPVANFYFKLRTSLTFSQVAPVADFAPGYACRWLFFRVAGVRRWFPSQVAHIIDFFPGRPLLIFPRLLTSLICFSHDSVADFSLCLSLHRSRQSLTGRASSCRCYFFPSCAYRWFFANSLEFFADFFFRLCASLTAFSQVAQCFFSCCSCRC